MINRLRLTRGLVVGALASTALLLSASQANASICHSANPPAWCEGREPVEPYNPPFGKVESFGDYDFAALRAHWADIHSVPDPTFAEGWRIDWDRAYHESHTHTTHIVGWAIDADTSGPIDVKIYSNDRHTATVRADVSRPDIARAYPGYGDRHGFDAHVAIGATPFEEVCARAVNVGSGEDRQLGCSYWWINPWM